MQSVAAETPMTEGKLPLVLVLYTGGTIGMKKLNDNGKIIGFRIRYNV